MGPPDLIYQIGQGLIFSFCTHARNNAMLFELLEKRDDPRKIAFHVTDFLEKEHVAQFD